MGQPTVIPGSICDVLRSSITGREYEVSVWRPAFAPLGPLPVVVVTDGNLMFPLATSTVPLLVFSGEMPPAIVVGVGYPTTDLAAIMDMRGGDLVPVRGDDTAGASGFFRFISEELWPWLSATYELGEDRTLFGDSLGGLFALHTLLNHHGFFRRYIIVSPAIVVDPDGCDADVARLATERAELDAVVLLAAGADEHIVSHTLPPELRAAFEGLDMVRHTQRVGSALAAGSHPGLRLTTSVVADQVHATMPFALMATGLRHVFASS